MFARVLNTPLLYGGTESGIRGFIWLFFQAEYENIRSHPTSVLRIRQMTRREFFFGNSSQLLAVKYFRIKLHLRCLTWSEYSFVSGIQSLSRNVMAILNFLVILHCALFIGTGIRAGVHVKLPLLSKHETFGKILTALRLQKRGKNVL